MKWERVAIGSIAKTVTKGTTPTSIGYDFSDRGIPFLRVNNIQGGELDIDDILFINDETDNALKRSRIQPRDVLLSIAGTIGRTAVVPDNAPAMNCNQAVAIIRLEENVSPRYLSHWLNTGDAYRQISGSKVTGTISNLSLGCIKNLEIPLPPIAEQRRIAAILDKADGVRRKRKEAIALTEELLRSAFLDMFGDPVTNPKGWEIKPLGDLLQNIESGWSPKCEAREADPDEWGVLKLGAVTYGHFDSHENKAMLLENSPRPELEIKKGDLLVTRKNTYELVGASTFVQQTRPKLMLPDLIFRLKVIEEIEPVYLWQTLSQRSMRFQLSRLAGGTAGSMPNISKARLRTLKVPVPPTELQAKYRAVANQFWHKKTHQVHSQTISENLFNSLLQRAFRGEL